MDAGMQPISIVIPTYNAVGQVEGLLMRLAHFQQKYGDTFQVIVSDDCSSDNTPAEIRRQFPWVDVLESRQNRGFGANVMAGVELARHPYLATLNSDIELVGNPCKELTDALERDKGLFAVMPLIFNRDLDKVENLARLYCHRGLCWHTELAEEGDWSSSVRDLLSSSTDAKARLRDIGSKTKPIRSVLCGAAFVCQRDRFLELGGFDSRYQPFYWEDVDLDYRARQRGWHCGVVPATAVIHRHSETIDRYHRGRKLLYLRLNQLRFVVAHQHELMKSAGLQYQHLWWTARALKECLGGYPALRSAYWRAGLGMKDF